MREAIQKQENQIVWNRETFDSMTDTAYDWLVDRGGDSRNTAWLRSNDPRGLLVHRPARLGRSFATLISSSLMVRLGRWLGSCHRFGQENEGRCRGG